jgi:hypothetical protein
MGPPIPKAFLEALAESFDEVGRAAVRHVRDNDPAEYARVFASIIPRDAATSDIYTDAQLERLCDALAARLAKAARNGVETVH